MMKAVRIATGLFGAIALSVSLPASLDSHFDASMLLKTRSAQLLVLSVLFFWFAALGHRHPARTRLWDTVQVGTHFWFLAFLIEYFGPSLLGTGFNEAGVLAGHAISSVGATLGLIVGIVWTRPPPEQPIAYQRIG